MKNNALKISAILAIVLGIIMALLLIISALKPKEELPPDPTEKPQISPKTTPKTEDKTTKEIEKTIKEIKKTLEDISELTPTPTPISIPTPQIIIQMPPIPTPESTPVPTPAPVETITPTPTPMPQESLKSLRVFDPQSRQGVKLTFGRHFVAIKDDIIDNETERSYMNIGLIVRDDNGKSVKDAIVEITSTSSEQNRILNGSGDITKIVNDNGVQETVYYYPFHYEFWTTGNHTITFQANGMTEVVSIKGVVEPAN